MLVPSPIHEYSAVKPESKPLPGPCPVPSSLRWEIWLLPEPEAPICRCTAPPKVPAGSAPMASPKTIWAWMSASWAEVPEAVASGSSVSVSLIRLVPADSVPVPSARVSSEYQPFSESALVLTSWATPPEATRAKAATRPQAARTERRRWNMVTSPDGLVA